MLPKAQKCSQKPAWEGLGASREVPGAPFGGGPQKTSIWGWIRKPVGTPFWGHFLDFFRYFGVVFSTFSTEGRHSEKGLVKSDGSMLFGKEIDLLLEVIFVTFSIKKRCRNRGGCRRRKKKASGSKKSTFGAVWRRKIIKKPL